MENALDTLKTAFPHPEPLSPTEDLEGDADGRIMDNKKYRWELYISPVPLGLLNNKAVSYYNPLSQFAFIYELWMVQPKTKFPLLDWIIWIFIIRGFARKEYKD